MRDPHKEILDRVRRLRVNRSGTRRAPHKPLLLLHALAELQQGQRKLAFNDVERSLTPLLDVYVCNLECGSAAAAFVSLE